MSQHLNVLFVGDINGRPGVTLVSTLLKQYMKKYEIDFCIANGENVSEGKSISEAEAKEVFDMGVHVITSGNHIWDRWQIKALLANERNLLRPLN